ncbi:MAG: hypothetical protein HYZ54_00700 [Ignavibacteriae bacterium]|nr:hypothetical protein [Ignavibacteriota bacterium]
MKQFLCRVGLSIIITVLLNYSASYGMPDSILKEKAVKMNKTISAYLGMKFNLGNSEFYTEYAKAFHVNNSYMVQPVFGITFRAEPITGIRFGASGEYFKGHFFDNFSQLAYSPIDSALVGFRSPTETIDFKAIPLLLTVDLIPSANQFRTYSGIGIGLCVGHIRWEEAMYSSVKNDSRIGGVVFDENLISPAGCIYAGLELGFDKKTKDDNFISLTIEARYTYVGMSAPMFKAISSQFFRPPESWQKNYLIGASSFSLQIGLSFQSPNI